jgi:hypothetical protein
MNCPCALKFHCQLSGTCTKGDKSDYFSKLKTLPILREGLIGWKKSRIKPGLKIKFSSKGYAALFFPQHYPSNRTGRMAF